MSEETLKETLGGGVAGRGRIEIGIGAFSLEGGTEEEVGEGLDSEAKAALSTPTERRFVKLRICRTE